MVVEIFLIYPISMQFTMMVVLHQNSTICVYICMRACECTACIARIHIYTHMMLFLHTHAVRVCFYVCLRV